FAAVRAPRISLSSGMSASRFCTRRASVSKRGSFASSGRSSAAQHFVQSALLATPSVRYASAALKTSYGTIEGWAFPRRAGRAPDVALADERPEYRLARRSLEVQGDALLVAVHGHEVRRLAAREGRPAPRVVALPRLFDLDDLGAHVAQNHRAEGSGKDAGEI